MIDHVLAFSDPMAASCPSQNIFQSPLWFQAVQAIASVATTVGVLTALYIAVVRDPRNATREHLHHMERMDALHRVTRDRAAAQARKVVPSCARVPIFGDCLWTVRIDNAGKAATTILRVDVTALDAKGFEVPDGCHQADNTVPADQVFHRAVRAARSESSDRLTPAFKQAIRDALAGRLVHVWPSTVPPNQYAVMAYKTTDPNYQLHVTIDYEDEAGYQWRRTDTSQPRSTDPVTLQPG